MYQESKDLVKKAFKIGKLLFTLEEKKYLDLYMAVQHILLPDEIDEFAAIEYIEKQYCSAAESVGLTKEHGLAMLEYGILLRELECG